MSTTSTIPIQVGQTIIQFPNSGSSPLWSPAIIQFAQLVAIQLQTIASPFDIAPAVDTLSSNSYTNLLLGGGEVSFPNGSVRQFTFTYAIYRFSTGGGAVSSTSTGVVTGVYNTTSANWQLQHEYSGDTQANGQSYETFNINGSNQLEISLVGLPTGTYDTGTISYSAKTELVTA